MRIGVICEGPTDFVAIKHFIKSALKNNNIETEFVSIQPEFDNTTKDAGWANLLEWLKRYPPKVRIPTYLGSGLFQGSASEKRCDALLLHMDADILEHASFQGYVSTNFKHTVVADDRPAKRASEICTVISFAAKLQDINQDDMNRHVMCPAVESTETWCVAAFFNTRSVEYEKLRGSELTNQFMKALEISESRRPGDEYKSVDKNVARREKFCKKHASGAKRIQKHCRSFAVAVDALRKLERR
jgi:hypothetical protein